MNRHAIALLTAALLLGVSCAHYRFGSALPKDMRDISVSEINNTTTEPSLGMLLQDALAEHIMNTPGVKLASRQDATLDVSVKIVMIDQGRLASARTRDSKARHSDSDSYQTVLYRLTMTCEYTARPTRGDTPPRRGSVEATADVPLMHDMALAQSAAYRELARDAAQKIAHAVCME